jgi:rhodanese-related sulfurtransferase
MEGWQSKAAFVIHVREGADVEAGRLEGRVEHIASYRAARFHSVEELVSFIAHVLAESKGRSELQ